MKSRNNPYAGPAALVEGVSIYGRALEIENLTDLLISARIVLLYSPSGAGKTSLIQAGLLKALRNDLRFSVSFIKGFGGGHHENNRYLGNLYEVLEGALPENLRMPAMPQSQSISLDEYLRNRPGAPQEGPRDLLTEEARQIPEIDNMEDAQEGMRDDGDEPSGHILIFDQFEEVFTLNPFDRDDKAEFFRQVGIALKDRKRCALFSMREDYIAELDDYLHLLPTQLKARYRLGLLDRPHAKEAIEGPARERGVDYETGAADHLVNELCKVRRQTARGRFEEFIGNFIEPVQLQVVCHRLWEHLYPAPSQTGASAGASTQHGQPSDDSDDRISRTEVLELSVDSALEQFYEDKVKAAALATGTSEGDIRSWFERELITPHGIRGQVLWEPERSGALPNVAIEHLENDHLVRMESRGGRQWYELAHDRLINPIRSSNAAWSKQLAPLQRATLEWDAQERRQDIFLSPVAWINASIWARRHRDNVRQSELDFLQHSRSSILQNQGLILILMAVIGIFIFLLSLTIITKIKLEQSEERLQISGAAYRAQIDASQRTMDHALLNTAQVAKKYQGLRHPEIRPGLASTIRETLFTTLRNSADIRRIIVGSNTVLRAIAFNPSSKGEPLFAYAGEEGAVVLAGVDNGIMGRVERVCIDDGNRKSAVYSLAFNNSGTLLAAGCRNGEVVVWNTGAGSSIKDWHESSRWRAHKGTWAVAFNRTGTQVASGGLGNDIKIMAISEKGEKLSKDPASLPLTMPAEPGPVAAILSLSFSPTENKLVAGDSKQFLWLCDTETLNECARTSVLQAADIEDRTWAIAFSPDGNHIATGHSSGRLLRWDVRHTIQNPLPLIMMPRPAPIYSVAFFNKKGNGESPDSPYVAYGADGLRQAALMPSTTQRQALSQRPVISPDEVYAVSLHPSTGLLAAATRSGYVAVAETANGPLPHVASRHLLKKGNPNTCSSQSGLTSKPDPGAIIDETGKTTRLIISSCGNLQLLDITRQSPAKLIAQQTMPAERVGQGRIERIAISSLTKRMATLGEDHTVKFWKLGADLKEDKSLPILGASTIRNARFEPESLQQIILSPDGKWLIAAFRNSGRFLLLPLEKRKMRKGSTIRTSFKSIHAITFSSDGKLIAIAGNLPKRPEKTPDHVELWVFNDGKPSRKNGGMDLPPLAENASDIVMTTNSSGRKLVAVGTSQGHIVIWNAETGKLMNELQTEATDAIYRLATMPAQQMIAAVDIRGKITLWDMYSEERLVLTNRLDRLEKTDLPGFALGGNSLVSVNSELTLWDLDITSLHGKVCRIIGWNRAANNSETPREVTDACRQVTLAQKP